MSVIMCDVPKFYNLYFLVHFRVLFDKQLINFFWILCAFTYSRLVLSAFLKGLSLLKVFWGNWGTVAVADPDLQIRGGGGVAVILNPEKRGGSLQKKKYRRSFGPQLGRKIRRGTGPPGPLSWICHWVVQLCSNIFGSGLRLWGVAWYEKFT